MLVSSFSAAIDLRELRRALSCEPLEHLPFQIRGLAPPCPARADTQRFMRLSWWRAVIAIASAPRMHRTDVVAHAGLGGFPLWPASGLIRGMRPWGVPGATVKHVVIGFLLIFLPGLLVLWFLLH